MPSAFHRVLLKVSGETFCRRGESGIAMDQVGVLAGQIKEVADAGVQVAVVTGGGNILRGKQFSEVSAAINAPTAHTMGMLATIINGLALRDALENAGQDTRLQSAIPMPVVCEPFIRGRCDRHLNKGRVVILSGGTGRPFVTTDTAAALGAREVGCDAVLKATKVDGIYSEDPLKNPHAQRYEALRYEEYLDKRLGVMDHQAVQHCKEADIPIVVFDYRKTGNILKAARGEKVGTRVGAG